MLQAKHYMFVEERASPRDKITWAGCWGRSIMKPVRAGTLENLNLACPARQKNCSWDLYYPLNSMWSDLEPDTVL